MRCPAAQYRSITSITGITGITSITSITSIISITSSTSALPAALQASPFSLRPSSGQPGTGECSLTMWTGFYGLARSGIAPSRAIPMWVEPGWEWFPPHSVSAFNRRMALPGARCARECLWNVFQLWISSVGRALDFDSSCRRFDPCIHCHFSVLALAQMEEFWIVIPKVTGSNPVRQPTDPLVREASAIFPHCSSTGRATVYEAVGCRFESCQWDHFFGV